MANSISTNISVNSTVDGVRTSVPSNVNTTTTSSNFLVGNLGLVATGYTAVSFASLNDVLLLSVVNDSTVYSQSVIQVTGSVGSPINTILIPGAQAVIPWSGSMTSISGKVIGSYPPFSLSTVQGGLGNIQFLVQQS